VRLHIFFFFFALLAISCFSIDDKVHVSHCLVGKIIAGSTAQSYTKGGGGKRSGSRGLSSEI